MSSALLKNLEILVLDCQATRAFSAGGRLMEIGWMATRGSTARPEALANAKIFRIRSTPPFDIPARVQDITGLTTEDLSAGHDENEIWQKLNITAQNIAAAQPVGHCLAAIHFARFETPFLRMLHDKCSAVSPFPLDIICTHEIARRLYPRLPRKGLCALAGYLGLSVASERRCQHHLAATAFIWRDIVARLEVDQGITTLTELTRWLAKRPVKRDPARTYPMQPAQKQSVAAKPGVYRMCRVQGDVLYIGKATSLRRRVNSYFAPRAKHPDHILEMLSQAREIDVTPTETALEAALLETDEIKRLAPPYNIALQTRRRALWFYSRDFRDSSNTCDDRHRIGPITDPQAGVDLRNVARLLSHEGNPSDDIAIWQHLTGCPSDEVPDKACLQSGIALFRQRHASTLARGGLPRILFALGARLWRRKMDTTTDDDEGEPAMDDADDDFSWTPEAITDLLERAVRHGTWQVRRARWLALLSRCTLAWEASDDRQEGRKRVLVIGNGIVVERHWLDLDAHPPHPFSAGNPGENRKNCFDIAVFDRIRVLGTEIRRLVSEDRFVELRLGPRFTLSTNTLKKALYWI